MTPIARPLSMTSKSNAEDIYRKALAKLIRKGVKISADAVAREVGNKPSAIRSDRMPDLVKAINDAAEEQAKLSAISGEEQEKAKKEIYKADADDYKKKYSKALEKIVSLENQVWELLSEIEQLKNHGKILTFNRKNNVKLSDFNDES